MLPKALNTLIDELKSLPGVGSRSAERYALALLSKEPGVSSKLADALKNLHNGVAFCQKTFVFVEPGQDVSEHYLDNHRDKTQVLVVADPLDAIAIEKTDQFKGTYHVLGGLVSPLDGIQPENLTISQLLQRIKDDSVTEVILATNASVEGESTALYIQQHIDNNAVDVTRLARGIPVGVDIEYTDNQTLARALEHRQKLNI
ncbi:TPA: recombination protein RecR [Candidatus Saccharibacteria bacterium]|nr:recombination protein RecR [Candidatus Saccharibacteria bacterium]HIO87341.1 recombination protein RecR [Candidatus Saccharibacteria bacterium]